MSQYPLFNMLSSRSKNYWYKIAQNPKLLGKLNFRKDLIQRLSEETGMPFDDTYKALIKELYAFVKEKSINLK